MLRIEMQLKYILAFLLTTSVLTSQDDTFVKRISALEGRHFMIGFMQNEINESTTPQITEVFITSTDTTKVTLYDIYTGNRTFTAIPNKVYTFIMDNRIIDTESEAFKNFGIEITSEKPVTVFAFCSRKQSSDSYNAVPISRWGNEYVVISLPNDQYASEGVEGLDSLQCKMPRRSEFMLLSATDGTEISFTPTVDTDRGVKAGTTKKITLNKGQCYLVKSAAYVMGYGDLSGTIVRGNQPFGVLSGHMRTSLPQGLSNPKDSKDHLIDMLMPVSFWGKTFATSPFEVNSTGDYFKIVARESGTHVTCYMTKSAPVSYTLPDSGSYVGIPNINKPAYWVADKPIQLGQLMMHNGGNTDTRYDPSLVTMPAVDQYIQKVTIITQGNDSINQLQYDSNFVNIVCDSEAVNYITYDGRLVKDMTDLPNQIVEGTRIHYARIVIPDMGQHTVETAKGSFTGILYGTGQADSYAMILGIGLVDISKPDHNAAIVTSTDSCGTVVGVISDLVGTFSSGLDYVKVRTDTIYNYQYTVDNVTDTSTVVGFKAWPVDKYKDALLVIEIKDKAGNFRIFRHFYNGVSLNMNKSTIEFSNIDYQGENTELLNFTYTGRDSMVVNNIDLKYSDPRLKLSFNKAFPVLLQKGQTFDYSLTYTPKGDISPLTDVIVIDLGCDRYVEIPVSGNVVKRTVDVLGWDFGKVTVGETAERYIELTNTGNAPLTLTGLNIADYTGCFSYDSAGKFPKDLAPGESYRITVFFTPKERIAYEDGGTYLNNYSLPNSYVLKGNGIAPLIPSVKIDWGRRRVGTTNDTLVQLQNDGNDNGRITFSGFSPQDTEFNGATLQGTNNELITSGSVLPFSVSFNPVTSVDHQEIANLTVNWRLHDTVRVELTGTGTIPVIRTYDVDFDTVELNSSKTLSSLLLEAGGNEDLTIDDIYIVGDKDPSFISGAVLTEMLDKSGVQKLQPGYSLTEDVVFKPDKPGYHEMTIEIMHDAAPSYKRQASRIRLTGYCNYSRSEASLLLPDSIIACRKFEASVVVKNTGMVDLNIQKLGLTHGNSDVELEWATDYTSLLPVTIGVDSSGTFLMRGFAQKDEIDEIFINMTINDTIEKQLSYSIDPVPSRFSVADMSDIVDSIGSTVEMKFTGSFSRGTELPVRFNMVLDNILKNLYYQIKPDVFLAITDENARTNYYPLTVVQEAKRITLDYPEPIALPAGGCTWGFTLQFKLLLGTELGTHVTAFGDYSECYEVDSINFYTGVDQVCMYKYSGVTLIEVPLTVKVLPNPVADRIQADIELSHDDVVDVSLFDNCGKKIDLGSNLFLKKGSHSLIFENMDLPGGAYMLSVNTPSVIVSTKLIIGK